MGWTEGWVKIFNSARCPQWKIFLALLPPFLPSAIHEFTQPFLELTTGLPPGTLLPQSTHFIQGVDVKTTHSRRVQRSRHSSCGIPASVPSVTEHEACGVEDGTGGPSREGLVLGQGPWSASFLPLLAPSTIIAITTTTTMTRVR